jgi:hypothetical protein
MEYTKDLIKWILIFIIVIILGLNIINYLSRENSNIIDASLETGAKPLIDSGKDVKTTIESELKKLEKTLDIGIIDKKPDFIQPDDTSSSIQLPKKSGYCFIGEDKGFRTCMYVGPRDECMSGDIFPSMEICINPNLRA